jgi:hypothetical protein
MLTAHPWALMKLTLQQCRSFNSYSLHEMEDILTFKMVNATFHLERNKLGRTGVLFV